ncbi:heterokaryon incompatibility protein-domain-containing protein [Cadophora sp. MPI-SDFR-AT-0126]|nr:heterokaryon incompatibility protein-domain-containing protein [Leotiomycetes sp. MPI-SDFR-AT-0126]
MSSFPLRFRRKDPQEPQDPYQYEPLPERNIRLLRLLPPQSEDLSDSIECEVLTTPLEEAKKFSALSYAWGDQNQDKTLRVKTAPKLPLGRRKDLGVIPITLNLFTALKYLRHPEIPVLLWADQVCINQNDVPERNAQVQMMRDIYETAERTAVWLGDEDSDTEILKAIYEKFEGVAPQQEPSSPGSSYSQQDPDPLLVLNQDLVKKLIQGEGHRPRREALIRFLGHDWFRRAWVYQEALVAAKVIMIWGSLHLPFDFVAGFILSSYSLFKGEEDVCWYQLLKKAKGFGPLRSIWFDRREKQRGEPLDFLHILWRARKYLDATDHRDFVYSFLGFHDFRPGFELRPDYTVKMDDEKYPRSVAKTLVGLARATIVSSGSLHIFRCIAPTKPSRYNLPSWVPNWAERRFLCGSPIVLPGVPNSFNACRGRQHDFITSDPKHHLLVQGHIIAHIRSVIEQKIDPNSYYRRSDDAIGLQQLALEASEQLQRLETESLSELSAHFQQYEDDQRLEKVLFRVILADGACSPKQPIDFSIDSLMKVHKESSGLSDEGRLRDHTQYQYIRQAGSVALGKKVFLTDRLEFGLGYSTMRCGDIVCLIYGSNTPCILRKSSRMGSGYYKLLGQCYLDGWMYGENAWALNWWGQEAKTFTLV